MVNAFLVISLFLFLPMLIYWLLLALAAVRPARSLPVNNWTPSNRFAITIPAHDEANVIKSTVQELLKQNYPAELFSINIVADHCTDHTAQAACLAGAVVYERNEGPRTGKGAALAWVIPQILQNNSINAVVIFDADTRVDPDFLRAMDIRLQQGSQVVQGQHIIANPDQGWFPALTWAMFIIDNRFQNLGRTNLGWSAKNMGDSICLQTDVLRLVNWESGLTEDYQLRCSLLLKNIKISYEPAARGYGEAPLTWGQARNQRARWLRGTRDSNQRYARLLLAKAVHNRDGALLDGALQAYLPVYSSLALLSLLFFLVSCLAYLWLDTPAWLPLVWGWIVGVLFLYPLFGLFLERAPLKAFLVIISGPFYIFWRTSLAFTARFIEKQREWIRTTHGAPK
ncbi:MAG TPA: glycosyltransferase family 2 protein [Anaerolineales bacterium]